MMAQSSPSIWTSSTALRSDRLNILKLPSEFAIPGAQFHLFHSAAPNLKREPKIAPVADKPKTRHENLTRSAHILRHPRSTQLERASGSATQMPCASIAASVWTEMHARYRRLNFFRKQDQQFHSDNQAGWWRFSAPQDRENGHQGDGLLKKCQGLLAHRRPFVRKRAKVAQTPLPIEFPIEFLEEECVQMLY